MQICDDESRILNYQQEDSTVARIIFEETPDFATMFEANKYIKDLKNLMNALFTENKNLHIINNDLKNEVARLEDIRKS